MQENCAAESYQQYDAHKRVGSKERCIQSTEIVSANEPVLVNKQCAGRKHSGKCDWSKSRNQKQPNQCEKRARVKRSRYPQRAADTDASRDGTQTLPAIEIIVLASVKYVEPSGP
jgi:hypothetical protein